MAISMHNVLLSSFTVLLSNVFDYSILALEADKHIKLVCVGY